ncbi:MAG: EamA family transporter [Acidobacteriota bacterium]|nr:EamA family transporter [Acidobacteriota bacterium]
MSPRDNFRAALVAIIWGANFVVIDEGLKGFPPFLLLCARFLVVLFPAIFLVPRPGPWRTILQVGLFMSLGQFALLYLSLHLGMPAGLASLLVQVQVIFSIGISRVFLREHPTRQQLLGVGVGLVGLAVLVAGRAGSAGLLPLVIIILACLAWSIGNVMSRSAQFTSGFGLTVWSGIVVPIPALALAFLVNGPHTVDHAVTHIGWLTIASTLYTAILCSLFGYGVWNSLLSRYPVGSVVPFALVVPVAGIATAWIALGQAPSISEVIGGAILLAGIATTTLQLRRAAARPTALAAATTLQRAAARPDASSADPYPGSAPPAPQPCDSRLSPSPASPA